MISNNVLAADQNIQSTKEKKIGFLSFEALQGKATINGVEYPMYSGFLPSTDLVKIAGVPSFSERKEHQQIALDLSNPPVNQWQRPLDDEKVNKIRDVYSRTDKANLMANPILIGVANMNIDDENVYIRKRQKHIVTPDGETVVVRNLFVIETAYLDDKKPLLISDNYF